MAKAKRYTAEQLRDAEKMAATLANVPEEKRTLVIMMTNSFMAGMEAQKAIDDTAKAAALELNEVRPAQKYDDRRLQQGTAGQALQNRETATGHRKLQAAIG